MSADLGAGRILRAKYLDWCSARVADRFLDLTPDEIYELAHQAIAAESATAGESVPPSPDFTPPSDVIAREALDAVAESYSVLVQRATEALTARIDLPSFEEWATAYAEAPGEFDREMLGFWTEESEPAGPPGTGADDAARSG